MWISFRLVIRDYGYGMSEHAQKNLFMNFSKLAEHKDKNPSGIGLGLSICKDLVKQMGGKVDVKSTLNKGTDFTIDLKTWCLVSKAKL